MGVPLVLLAASLLQGVEEPGSRVSFANGGPSARHEFTQPAMGTDFRIVMYASDAEVARAAADAAFQRIDELDRTLSDYAPQSELSLLSRSAGTGEWVVVSTDLWNVISLAQTWAARTQGAFDITVGPLTSLWRWANRRGRTMPPDRALRAMESVGYEKLQMDAASRAVRLTVPGMRLDAGGIGKGFAADEALAVLRARGFGQALVDAGGDVRVGDAPPDRQGWEVAVPELDPSERRITRSVRMSNTAVATSGDTYRYTTDGHGVRRSHILDPRAGRSVTSGRIVTVSAECAAVADMLASAASVMTDAELRAMPSSIGPTRLIRILELSEDRAGWELQTYQSTGTK